MLRLSGLSVRDHHWARAALALFSCVVMATLAAAQSCSVDISTNPPSPVPAGQSVSVNATLNSSGGLLSATNRAAPLGGGGSADVSYDGAAICSSFSGSCTTTIDPGSAGLHTLAWSCSDNNGPNSGSQTLQVTSAGPTPTPTPTGTPLSGGIAPKYVVLAVTYAPPGSQSTVSYMNSTMLGTSLSVSSSFIAQANVTATLSAKINSIFGFGSSTTTMASTTFTQEADTSASIAINETATRGTTIRGPSSSAVGLSHDADIIWVWLNPVFNFTIPSPNNIQWTAVSFDPLDPVGGLDVFGIQVKYLNGHAVIPSDIADVLARRWALPLADGSGPGLTATDLAAILKADPFSDPTYTINVPTGSACTADGRFCRTTNENFQYAPPPPGDQPVTETFSLVHQETATEGQGAAQTLQVGFTEENKTLSGAFITTFASGLKSSQTLTLMNKFNVLSTQQVGQTATLSVTGPTSADNYTGPVEFNVFQDNIYGSFMFAFVTEPTFTLSSTPDSQNTTAGACASYTASIAALVSGFNSNITLSVSGLPPGATQSFTPPSITGAGSSTLTVCTASSTPLGSSSLTINATSGQEAHSTIVTLTVGPPPDFALSATPGSQTIPRGQSASYTLSFQPLNGFNGSVALGLSGLPSGASAGFSSSSISGAGSSTLAIITTSSTPTGPYTLTITGTSGSLVHSIPVTLTVSATPPPPPPPPPPPDPCTDPTADRVGSSCVFQIQ